MARHIYTINTAYNINDILIYETENGISFWNVIQDISAEQNTSWENISSYIKEQTTSLLPEDLEYIESIIQETLISNDYTKTWYKTKEDTTTPGINNNKSFPRSVGDVVFELDPKAKIDDYNVGDFGLERSVGQGKFGSWYIWTKPYTTKEGVWQKLSPGIEGPPGPPGPMGPPSKLPGPPVDITSHCTLIKAGDIPEVSISPFNYDPENNKTLQTLSFKLPKSYKNKTTVSSEFINPTEPLTINETDIKEYIDDQGQIVKDENMATDTRLHHSFDFKIPISTNNIIAGDLELLDPENINNIGILLEDIPSTEHMNITKQKLSLKIPKTAPNKILKGIVQSGQNADFNIEEPKTPSENGYVEQILNMTIPIGYSPLLNIDSEGNLFANFEQTLNPLSYYQYKPNKRYYINDTFIYNMEWYTVIEDITAEENTSFEAIQDKIQLFEN